MGGQKIIWGGAFAPPLPPPPGAATGCLEYFLQSTTTSKKNVISVSQTLKTMTSLSLSQKHLVADTKSIVNVLKDGQNCPLLTTIRYDTIRCAYCRTMYPYEEYCFLCLRKKTNNQRLMKTNCCQSTIHNRCVEDLLYILAHLSYEFTLARMWTNIMV